MSRQLHASECCMVVWVLQSGIALSIVACMQDAGCITLDIGCVWVVQTAEGELLEPQIPSQEREGNAWVWGWFYTDESKHCGR